MNDSDFYASRRTLPVIVLTEEELAIVARLAERCKTMRTSRVLRAVEEDPVVRHMRSGIEHLRDRAAYISGLVVAEVAIARLNARAA